MPRTGRRRRIERGISQDDTHYSVRVSVGTGTWKRSREARFPLTVDLPYLRAQRALIESALRAMAPDVPVPPLHETIQYLEHHATILKAELERIQIAIEVMRGLLANDTNQPDDGAE